jgi:hypothetical protein
MVEASAGYREKLVVAAMDISGTLWWRLLLIAELR